MPAADTVPGSRRGWDGGKRTNGAKRHIAVDVNGLLLAVVVTAASIQDRDAAHQLLAGLGAIDRNSAGAQLHRRTRCGTTGVLPRSRSIDDRS
ncbi:transposase [Rhodococcus koreensis]